MWRQRDWIGRLVAFDIDTFPYLGEWQHIFRRKPDDRRKEKEIGFASKITWSISPYDIWIKSIDLAINCILYSRNDIRAVDSMVKTNLKEQMRMSAIATVAHKRDNNNNNYNNSSNENFNELANTENYTGIPISVMFHFWIDSVYVHIHSSSSPLCLSLMRFSVLFDTREKTWMASI